MRIIRNVLIGLAALAGVLAAGAYVLPRHVIVEREIVIDAPPAEVFPLLNSLERGADWSPWLSRDPEADLVYSGPSEGVGATLDWASDDPSVGTGRQEIVESVPDARVASALDFGGSGTALAWFDLEPEEDGTRITWGLNADMGNNPVGRWMGLMMDGWVGADYERGLENLRTLVESGAATDG